MPKVFENTNRDQTSQAAMYAIGRAAELHLDDRSCIRRHSLSQHLMDRPNLKYAAQVQARENGKKISFLKAIDVATFALTQVETAQDQTHTLLRSIDSVIPTSFDVARRPSVIRASRHIGRLFGAISGADHPSGYRTIDDHVLADIHQQPTTYLTFDADAERVTFNPHAVARLKELAGPEAGCPAMGLTVMADGDPRTNLFGLLWDHFSEDYMASQAMLPSQSPRNLQLH